MGNLKHIIVLVEHHHGYFRDILRGIRTYVRQGRPWILHTVDSASEWLKENLGTNPDGFIGHTGGAGSYRFIKSSGIPAVHTVQLAEEGHAPFVTTDDLAVGRMAAAHFLGRRLQTFAYAGERDFVYSRLREKGFLQTIEKTMPHASLHRFHNPVPPSCVFGAGKAERRARNWLMDIPRPFGLFAANDTWASVFEELCLECGMRIPDDIAILGVDNDDLVCETAHPPLSSVQTPGQVIGYEAARLLDARMGGATVPDVTQFPPMQIVERESTGTPSQTSRPVACALQYIRDHASQPASVADIVRAAHVSRRKLEVAFREELGRTILEELHQAHVERARHLLLETDFTMPAIAEASGFPSATRFGIVFRRVVGIPPTEYRHTFRISDLRVF